MPAVRLSRYEFAPIHEDACGRRFLDVPDPVSRRPSLDDIRHIVGEGDTLFTIAWRYYRSLLDRESDIGPSRFFWVIAQANSIVDVTAKLKPGRELRIPSVANLETEILAPPRFFDRSFNT